MTEANDDNVDWAQYEKQVADGTLPPGVSEFTVVGPEMLAKRFVRDVVPCDMAVDVANRLSLQPASDDVEDMEHTQSHARLNNVSITAPFLSLMAPHAANAVAAALVIGAGADVDDEDLLESAERLTPVVYATTLSIIAELVEMGVLHTPHFSHVTLSGVDEE